jgi:hypothetical protein
MLAEAIQAEERTTFQKSDDAWAWIAQEKEKLGEQVANINRQVARFAKMFPSSKHQPSIIDNSSPEEEAHPNSDNGSGGILANVPAVTPRRATDAGLSVAKNSSHQVRQVRGHHYAEGPERQIV